MAQELLDFNSIFMNEERIYANPDAQIDDNIENSNNTEMENDDIFKSDEYKDKDSHEKFKTERKIQTGETLTPLETWNIASEYVRLRYEQEKIRTEIANLQNRLEKVFEETGKDVIQTSAGAIRRIRNKDGKTRWTLEVY
ncbi:MAG: hypothetical protein HQK76_14950 [Desulfobacterales bacterium]|nr:hypothetical protein [Desulfobacterales bacterium]